ncbi:MAG: NAD(P)/FAD-dependent oxidoreductase [Candidatus Hodarchaeales archaeon]|jgi:NADPH-dependent 2,4-dienoyl-CoA reductase/sulfur reductase-like enzyme
MKEITTDLVIIGGGPAGMAAALAARELGVTPTIIERDNDLGGILQQCIHPGFGLHVFDEELTGPEFGERYKKKVLEAGIPVMLDTIVTGLTSDKMIIAFNPAGGLMHIYAKVIVLAMGARERHRGAIKIPGSRPAGVYTAGLAQRFINIEGKMPGKDVVILGSGDIGMIMARRLTLEGAKVHKVVEILPYPSGLIRNKVQCLDDFGIPLVLKHTVTRIHGKGRLEAVTIAKVDDNWKPIPGTEETIACDTLLLSVGLIPEIEFAAIDTGMEISSTGGPVVNESLETSVEGIFSCGNVLHVNDLVDNVVKEGVRAGISAVRYLKGKLTEGKLLPVIPGDGVLYIIPQRIHQNSFLQEQVFQLRVREPGEKIILGIHIEEKLLKKARIRFAMPSELITLTLSPINDEIIGESITISVLSEEMEVKEESNSNWRL